MLVLILLIFIGIITIFSLINAKGAKVEEIFLTDEERTWLDEHKDEIKIGYTIDYPPVEFLDNGKFVGISADYFKLLEQKLGIKFQMVQFDNFDELIKQVQKKELTGITAATKTTERGRYLDFTVPYIENPNVIITRKNFSENLTFEKLENTSMDILVVEGYDIIEFLNESYPKLEYRTVKSPNDGMRMVAFGEADAMIIEIMSATETIERDNISNLIVNVETPYQSSLSIATRSDWPILNYILNKGLAQITHREKKVIEQKWMSLQGQSLFQNIYFWIGVVCFILLLIIIIIVISVWNSSLQAAVKEKTQAIEESKKELMFKTYHDELTGLYNRMYMAETLKQLKQENALPFSIIVADLNGLKITNDTFGHEIGDRMLIRVSEIIKENIKSNHVACRIGGDEIVVFMPSTDERESIEIVEKIQNATLIAKKDPIKPLVALGCATMYDYDNNGYNSFFKLAEDRMYANKIANSERNYDMIINAIKKKLYENNNESKEHCKRLVEMCRQMGEILGLEKSDIESLALLAELHDIGKVGIEKELFLKEGTLTMEEWQKIKSHPELGFKIVSGSTKLSYIGKSIFAHHEHWDGSGYPQGLKGEEIPFTARLFSILEAYDVMTHERSYKPIYTKEMAIQELKDNLGTQFDPNLVEKFVNYISNA
ncbi:diguanylate cyclase (GGDEF)-like protein [Sedimentibacter acidaminivorans]|uniref:Diguanylate cyclase (GGDEF)-like protein n=1 Tax=Sedimentibacter acidaminivorans TaxID=913099 RepID=A0ABS4GBK2_9FIRM|nr:transporter substrate-binding domain-containing protein [Sedimentibacter acidaminivorans]MBP1924780.1 diguanylate cyclase (GGDEF)-like protein [Sedimentibacter acidaminivorans]